MASLKIQSWILKLFKKELLLISDKGYIRESQKLLSHKEVRDKKRNGKKEHGTN